MHCTVAAGSGLVTLQPENTGLARQEEKKPRIQLVKLSVFATGKLACIQGK